MIYKLENGDEVETKMTFKGLVLLKEKEKSSYEKVMATMKSKDLDLVNMLYIIYIGYKMEKMKTEEEYMSFEEFAEVAPFDIEQVASTFEALIMQKKI